MANNEMWSLESLTYTPFVLNGAGTDFQLKFKVFKGSFYIDVIKSGAKESEVFKSLSMVHKEILMDNIDKIMEAGPETHRPIVIGKYDKEQHKFVTDFVIELFKDSKLIYHICILVKGNKFDFILSGPAGISIGSDPLSEPDRSMYCIKSLKRYLEFRSEIQTILSNKRRDPSTYQNNRGGNRYTNGPKHDEGNAGGSSEDSGSQYF